MAQLTKKQYQKIAVKLSKTYTAETVYPALESAGFEVELKGVTYSVYASRVIALMHELKGKGKALKI